MFNLEIFHLKVLEDFVSDDPEKLDELGRLFEEINLPYFHLKEIGVSSKIIGDWTKAGLINNSFEQGKWRQFSFCEAIWIKFVEELRYYGTDIKYIKELKELLFPANRIEIEATLDMIKRHAEESNPLHRKFNLLAEKHNIFSSQVRDELLVAKYNVFTSLLIGTIALKLKLAFYIDEIGMTFIDLARVIDKSYPEKMEWIIQNFTKKSFALININNIICQFFDNEKLAGSDSFYFSLMNKNEKDVIEKIKSGKFRQIIIKMEDGSITQLRLSKKQDDDLVRKISKLMKKGEFKEVNFIVRDGVPVKFEETDIVKVFND